MSSVSATLAGVFVVSASHSAFCGNNRLRTQSPLRDMPTRRNRRKDQLTAYGPTLSEAASAAFLASRALTILSFKISGSPRRTGQLSTIAHMLNHDSACSSSPLY